MTLQLFRVNERRYEFGDESAAAEGTIWVCSKVPNNGKVKKDCIPKVTHVLNPQIKTDYPSSNT